MDPSSSDLVEDEDDGISSSNSGTIIGKLEHSNLGSLRRHHQHLLPENGDGDMGLRSMDEHICGICRAEFVGLARFIAHKKECHSSDLPIDVGGKGYDGEIEEEDEEEGENGTIIQASKTNHSSKEGVISSKRKNSSTDGTSDKVRSDGAVRKSERVERNHPTLQEEDCSSDEDEDDDVSRNSLTFNESNIMLQSLQNTRVAVAQHHSLSSPSTSEDQEGGNPSPLPPQLSPKAAAAQLCSLQQQHVMLMSVIHQLTSQLMTNQGGQGIPPQNPTGLPIPLLMPQVVPPGIMNTTKSDNCHLPQSPDRNPLKRESPSDHPSASSSSFQSANAKRIALSANRDSISSRSCDKPLNIGSGESPKNSMHALQNMISESSSMKRILEPTVSNPIGSNSTINNPISGSSSRDESSLPLIPSPLSEPLPVSEPNTLELLQRHTEQALQNTMSGSSFLVNGVSGSGSNEFLRFRKDGKEDPSLRHRCKYCGKVFGSDSALQIHIRSHTGERPFKCNICGNRFSTKGNLKVHFQRHRAKYPHVKMNPNPVPEHLDKFHPPLEPPSGSQSPTRSQSPIPPMFPPGYNNNNSGMNNNNSQLGTIAQNTLTSFSHSIPNMIQTAMDLKAKINQTKEYIAASAAAAANNHGNNVGNRSIGSLMSQMDLQSAAAATAKSMMDFRHLKTSSNQSPGPRPRSSSPNEHSNGSSNSTVSSSDGKKVRKSNDIYDTNQKKSRKEEERKEESHNDDDGERHDGMKKGGGMMKCSKKKEENERSMKEGEEEEYELRRRKKVETSQEDEEEENEEGAEEVTNSGPPGNHHSRQESSCHELSDNEQPDEEEENDDDENEENRGILRRAAIKAAAELNRRKSHKNDEDDEEEDSNDTGTNSFKHGLSGKEDMGDDEDDRRVSNKQFPFLAPNFQSFFQHGVFPSSLAGMMPPFSMPPTMTTSSMSAGNQNQENCGISGDPILYQDLLPKPGSTDNSWESLMEIQKASETTKLQNLVDNIENKLTDPNQCIICHRILSCKSALQMHYRTHTGERPFKCKICGRAFTTKGNLKTHMGVHRVKPPLRILHQCPVCHKQFTNALVLQQHIRIHTGEPTDMSPEQMLANEIKSPLGSFLPNSSFHRHLLAAGHFGRHPMQPPHLGMGHPFFPNMGIPGGSEMLEKMDQASDDGDESDGEMEMELDDENSRRSLAVSDEMSEGVPSRISEVSSSPAPENPPKQDPSEPRSRSPSMSTSLTALENHVKTINSGPPSAPQLPFGSFGMGLHQLQYQRYIAAQEQNRQHMKLDEMRAALSQDSMNSKESVDGRASPTGADERSTPGSKHGAETGSAIDLTPKVPNRPGMPITPETAMGKNQSPSHSPMTPPQLGQQMFPPLFAGLPFPTGRTSTTCRICLKTFACNSALEIHYRSHTKERPFKCDVCDRGFSTKGNMKQHMLTHKIRDLPASLYTTTTTPSTRGVSSNPRSVGSSILSCDSNGSDSSLVQAHMARGEADTAETGSLPGRDSERNSETPHRSTRARSSSPGDGNREPSSSSSTGSNRHMCHVCKKPFSSHSALQIHMRTHTGDKPFQCSICSRAFTTKGNLKVHMGKNYFC